MLTRRKALAGADQNNCWRDVGVVASDGADPEIDARSFRVAEHPTAARLLIFQISNQVGNNSSLYTNRRGYYFDVKTTGD